MTARTGSSPWLALCFGLTLFIATFWPTSARAFDVPPPEGAVTDRAGVLSNEDDAFLEERVAAHRAKTGEEIGVLVVSSLEGATVESAANQTFNRWGIGKKGIDNGVLLLIAVADRKTRLETGNGVRSRISDAQAAQLLARLAPHLRAHRYREGIGNVIGEIAASAEWAAAKPSSLDRRPSTAGGSSRDGSILWVVIAALGVLCLGAVALSRGSRGSRGWSGGQDASSYWVVDTSSTTTYSAPPTSTFDAGSSSASTFSGGSSDGGGASGSF